MQTILMIRGLLQLFAPAECVLYSLELTAKEIGLRVNIDKTEFMF